MAERKYVQSIERAFDIIDCIATKKATRLKEVCKILHLKAPTAHAIMQTLEHRGYLIRVEKTQYALGINALKMGLSFKAEAEKKAVVDDLLSKFVEVTGKTVFLEMKIEDENYLYSVQESPTSYKFPFRPQQFYTLPTNSSINLVYRCDDENVKFTSDFGKTRKNKNYMSIPVRTNGKIEASISLTDFDINFSLEDMEECYNKIIDVVQNSRFRKLLSC